MDAVTARYREFEPCPELRPYVRALFTFAGPPLAAEPERSGAGPRVSREFLRRAGEPFWSALFADGHVSLNFCLGTGFRIDDVWNPPPGAPRAYLIGAMSR